MSANSPAARSVSSSRRTNMHDDAPSHANGQSSASPRRDIRLETPPYPSPLSNTGATSTPVRSRRLSTLSTASRHLPAQSAPAKTASTTSLSPPSIALPDTPARQRVRSTASTATRPPLSAGRKRAIESPASIPSKPLSLATNSGHSPGASQGRGPIGTSSRAEVRPGRLPEADKGRVRNGTGEFTGPSETLLGTPSQKETFSNARSLSSRSSSLVSPSIRASNIDSYDTLRSSINDSVTEEDVGTVLVSESLHDLEPDMKQALRKVQDVHLAKLSSYRRLLSEKDSTSARSLHDLHAEIQKLAEALAHKDNEVRALKYDLDKLRQVRAQTQPQLRQGDRPVLPASSSPKSGPGSPPLADFISRFDEGAIRAAVRQLNGQDRLRLLRIVLESVMPGDISAMQAMLAKYAASSFDIVGRLPIHLGAAILSHLPVSDVLMCRSVSKRWDEIVTSGWQLWRQKVFEITATDTTASTSPTSNEGWFPLYKALHHRESNWHRGLAQEIVLLEGHKGFVTSLKKHGDTVVTGSYDETIRIWSARTGKCLKILHVSGSIACLDYLQEESVVACGCHDVGKVYVLSTLTGTLLTKLSGHNKGLKAVAINSRYLVSAGMDKALVVWDWRNGGKKIVRFGQQTNVNIGIALIGSKLVSVQVDGTVRTFDLDTRTMIGQFTMKDLLRGHSTFQPWLASLSLASTNVVMWFAANSDRITMGTRDFLLYFRWEDFHRPPTLCSWIPTDSSTNDLAVGVSDPSKQRVLTSVRFASRTGTDRRIYIGHFKEATSKSASGDEGEAGELHLIPIAGAWAASSADLHLDSPQMNPMTLACDNERVIVGCTSGLVYTISFVGYQWR